MPQLAAHGDVAVAAAASRVTAPLAVLSSFIFAVGAVVLFSLTFRLLLLLQFFFSLVLLLGIFLRELFELVHFLRIAAAFLPFSRLHAKGCA